MDKDNFNANVDFVRGQADMIVLSALADGDRYGLEILNAIQEKSKGMYSLKQATLYSSLKRLEKNGYVHSYDGDVSNGAKRVYYGLTEQGREHLENDKSYWEFCNFLMSSLISDNKFDPLNEEKPFDPADFRPLTRRSKSASDGEKVVIKYVYLNQEAPNGEGGLVENGSDYAEQSEENGNVSLEIVSSDEQNNEQTDELVADNDIANAADDIAIESSIVDAISEYSERTNDELLAADNRLSNSEQEITDETLEIYSDLKNQDYSVDKSDIGVVESQTQVQDSNSDFEEKLAKIVEDLAEIKEKIGSQNSSTVPLNEEQAEGVLREEHVTIDEEEQQQNSDVNSVVVAAQEGNAVVENAQQESYSDEYQGYGDTPRPSPLFQTSRYFDENNEVNYVASFSDMFNSIEDETISEDDKDEVEFMTMKEMVYKFHAKGVKIKPYDKKDTMEFYVNRYYYANKLHLHTSLIIFAVLFVELLFAHLICNRNGAMPAWALILALVGVGLYPLARYVVFIIDPTKKTPATFNLKTALLISLLPIITLPIVIALLAFVQFGANIHDYSSMERTIFLPICLLFNIPLYFIVFEVLYRTYKYHIN